MTPILNNKITRTHFEAALGEHLDANRRLDCPYCRQSAIPNWIEGAAVGLQSSLDPLYVDLTRKYDLILVVCAGCGNDLVFVRKWRRDSAQTLVVITEWIERAVPLGRTPRSYPNTHEKYTRDYHAACRTLATSAEASACMSRRCLQNLLRDQGYAQKDLAPQIDALLNDADPKKILPIGIHQEVDAVRCFGNFGAHSQIDSRTLEIIPVEPGEAEWCIEIIESLFSHYFERPAEARAKIAMANQKFGAAGKPNIKT